MYSLDIVTVVMVAAFVVEMLIAYGVVPAVASLLIHRPRPDPR